ncbi:MAG: creatininase family protein [Bryobacteraceae bacterium]
MKLFSLPVLLVSLGAATVFAQSNPSPCLEDLTHPEVRSRQIEVALLPIGSTEPHAKHLPYANDTLSARILAERVAAKANAMGAKVLVLPTMPYGVNSNQAPNPYAQSIRPATLMQFIKDVVDVSEHQGIRKIVILNAHGGNTTTIAATLRELFASNPQVFAAQVDSWISFPEKAKELIKTGGDHADEQETSISLALFPDKVYMDRAVKAKDTPLALPSLRVPYIHFMRPWMYVSDNTGTGDPTQATAEKGRVLVGVFLDRISNFLKELSDAKLTGTFPFDFKK